MFVSEMNVDVVHVGWQTIIEALCTYVPKYGTYAFGMTVVYVCDISHTNAWHLFRFCTVTIYYKSLMHVKSNSLHVKTGNIKPVLH